MCSNKGQNMYNLAKELYPICRSITGPGVRETLSILADYIMCNNEDGGALNLRFVMYPQERKYLTGPYRRNG